MTSRALTLALLAATSLSPAFVVPALAEDAMMAMNGARRSHHHRESHHRPGLRLPSSAAASTASCFCA